MDADVGEALAGPADAGAVLDMDAVKSGYCDLMDRYNRALGQASWLGRSQEGEPPQSSSKYGFAAPSLVRLMVRVHVRQRLYGLATGFLQLIPTMESEQSREWLDRAREDCEKIAQALPRIQLRPLLLAVIAPLAAVLSKLPGLPDWLVIVMLSIAAAIPSFLVLGYFTVRGSYRTKRELLLPNATEIDKMSVEQQRTYVTDNAYEAESRVFAAIGRGKRLERELDQILIRLGVLLLAEVLCFLPFALDSYGWVSVALGLALFVVYFLLLKFERKRVWC